MTDIGAVCSFQRRKYDVFYWKIDKFSELSEKENDCYHSPEFRFKGHRSYLLFYPHGQESCLAEDYLALYLYSEYDASDCVRLTLGLKTRNGSIEKWLSRNIIYPEEFEVGSAALIRRTELLKRKAELVPSDCLTFVLFLSKAAPEIIRDVTDQAETDYVEENDHMSEKKGNDKVIDDMGKLLRSGDKSDAMVIVEEVEFKVHSCILSARTPVFAALFKHDTLEKANTKINITDCEPAIFKEFLNYIYTGSVQNLSAESALDLYRVADKYLVKDLKEVCRKCIVDNLSTETFCEAVQLAQRCGDKDLLQSAFDYCAANIRHIIRSGEWQRYIKENPIEANEILIRSFGSL